MVVAIAVVVLIVVVLRHPISTADRYPRILKSGSRTWRIPGLRCYCSCCRLLVAGIAAPEPRHTTVRPPISTINTYIYIKYMNDVCKYSVHIFLHIHFNRTTYVYTTHRWSYLIIICMYVCTSMAPIPDWRWFSWTESKQRTPPWW